VAATGGKPRGSDARGSEGAPLSREVLGHLMGVMHAMKDHVAALAATLDVTPSQLAALSHLDKPRSQRELAESLHFDASNITDIVDRLEARGLVVRTVDPTTVGSGASCARPRAKRSGARRSTRRSPRRQRSRHSARRSNGSSATCSARSRSRSSFPSRGRC
jgi:hypothetical protein